jgi:tetratricopeptide (TPR) repeat protein
MKILITICGFLLLSLAKVSAESIPVDTLKHQLATTSDSLKGLLYARIAAEYLHYDTISNKQTKLAYQSEAIANTLKAVQYYSKYNDTLGLRTSFNNLATVYRDQKKYSQAKWFILQSNTISRIKNDVPNIISSLLLLASVKTDIKDYTLAMQDLNEALALAGKNAKTQAAVQLGYVLLYNNMQNYPKADMALKRYNFIYDSIRRGDVAKVTAIADSTQKKKKLYLTTNKRLSNTNSSKKTILL